jgi:hypothetical protein
MTELWRRNPDCHHEEPIGPQCFFRVAPSALLIEDPHGAILRMIEEDTRLRKVVPDPFKGMTDDEGDAVWMAALLRAAVGEG